MGFLSTFTTNDVPVIWPKWFYKKYAKTIVFNKKKFRLLNVIRKGALNSKHEAKAYGTWINLHKDIQQAIDWNIFNGKFILVYLHECGGISRCQIEQESIKWSTPHTWVILDDNTGHSYCYGCSDI